MTSNFQFLQEHDPFLFNIAASAEMLLNHDAAASIIKSRLFGEKLSEILYDLHGLESYRDRNFNNILRELSQAGVIPQRISDLFYILRKKGNEAAHDNSGTQKDALLCLSSAFHIYKWYALVYLNAGELKGLEFQEPVYQNPQTVLYSLEQQYQELELRFNELKAKSAKLTTEAEEVIKSKTHQAAANLCLSESETREIIDEMLTQAGWEADTENIRFGKGSRPESGRNKAIAEWPIGNLKADYALFAGSQFIGIVEAKRQSKDVVADLEQAKNYSKKITDSEDFQLSGPWNSYKVPFMFATNGRPYNKQLESKSGIWFLDGRKNNNHPKALQNWYTPEGLKALYEQDIDKANQRLKVESLSYLQESTGLNLRKYQIEAIKAVEKKITETPDDPRALIAMATGTGKTRTILGLCHRLINTDRFKRILFLVDRSLLGDQASAVFKDVHIIGLQTFKDIFDIQELKDKKPELDTRIHFATVQSMVKRIFYTENDQVPLPVDSYDCIIIDEAHRGYTLDKEMDSEELEFKNQRDYLSKYKMVLDYFDAYRIGLTATPAVHTTDIFGEPVYRYSYRQAVIDGFLADQEPPYQI